MDSSRWVELISLIVTFLYALLQFFEKRNVQKQNQAIISGVEKTADVLVKKAIKHEAEKLGVEKQLNKAVKKTLEIIR